MNDIVGDYLGNYKYKTRINELIIEMVSRSKIVKIVMTLLNSWVKFSIDNNKKEESNEFVNELIDQNVAHCCLKLLVLMLNHAKNGKSAVFLGALRPTKES